MALTLTTRLDAINVILRALGFPPINTLTGAVTADVATAEDILDETSKEVQSSKTWNFNYETGYPLVPNVDGEIEVPSNASEVDLDTTYHSSYSHPVALRGTRLYHKKERSFTAFSSASTWYANIRFMLEWDDLPEPLRRYIMIRAARRTVESAIGDETLVAYTDRDERDAKLAAERFDSKQADRNILSTSIPGQILARRGPRSWR